MSHNGPLNRRAGVLAVGVLLTSALLPMTGAQAATPLVGTFTIAAGSCAGGTASGSYIRMILPSGSASGPYMSNSDSTCRDQTFTLLKPGVDGGLKTGGYQSPPSPAFDSSGNALANRITAPANFYGTNFATGSNARDPQTGVSVPVPSVSVSAGRLSADLRAFAVTWNSQNFNQGAPKPDGSFPGNTRSATGSYDASTGAYTLQWTSQVVGGPFDKFTGQWHLTGRFIPARSSGAGNGTSAPARTSTPAPATTTGGTAVVAPPPGGSSSAATSSTPSSSSSAPSAPPGSSAPAPAGPAATPVASTTTISRDTWRVSWWVIAVAIAIGVAGVVSLLALNRRIRSGGAA